MTTLEMLLVQIRDGTAGPGSLDRARALAADDERIPAELCGEVFLDPSEASADAAGLLAVLGADDLGELIASAVMDEISTLDMAAADAVELELDDAWAPIGAALREGLLEEAVGFEIADAVMRRIPVADFPWGPVLARAVASEAGAADIVQGVIAALPSAVLAEQAPVAAAIRQEAGTVDVSSAVMGALGIEVMPVAEAVRAYAGPVDVVDRVMALLAPEEHLVPANNRWVFASLLMAAVALLVVVAGRLTTPIGGTDGEPLRFARASEVIVEDLSYASDVQVMVLEGDDGAVILWFDEEV